MRRPAPELHGGLQIRRLFLKRSIGFSVLQLSQLKILQEAITLTVFVPFAVFYMREPIKLDSGLRPQASAENLDRTLTILYELAGF